MTAASTIHALAGSPIVDGCEAGSGICWVCAGSMARGMSVKKWQGSAFTDQNKARHPDGTHVCEACVWAMAWNQPPGFPPPEPGKKGLNLRLFSHFHDSRGYRAWNKANKAEIRAWLRGDKRGPWFAAIADTGQKHVLPWTPVNPAGGAGGVVRFEERNVSLPRTAAGWSIVDAATDLLTYGVTKDEIARGEYSVRTYQTISRETVQAFEEEHGRHRGGAWFDLVLWLSQRNEEAYENRRKQGRSTENGHSKRAARDAGRVPTKRSKPAEALDAAARPGPDDREDKRQRTGLGDSDVPEPATADDGQLSLFGGVDAK